MLVPCAARAPRLTLSAMRLPTLRSLLPRSLFGRALTILLVPIVVLQLVVGLVFFQRHYQRVTEQMTRNVAYELAYARRAGRGRRRRRGGAAARLAELALPLDLRLTLDAGRHASCRGSTASFLDLTGATVAATLDRAIRRPDPRSTSRPTRARARIAIGTSRGALEARGAARPAVGLEPAPAPGADDPGGAAC